MALRVKVCRAEDVAPGQVRGFDSAGGLAGPLLVANIDGELVAASAICPHEDVSLLGGEREGERVIVCPGHGYGFDLATGACTHDPRLCLPVYRVTVVDGEVWVDLIP